MFKYLLDDIKMIFFIYVIEYIYFYWLLLFFFVVDMNFLIYICMLIKFDYLFVRINYDYFLLIGWGGFFLDCCCCFFFDIFKLLGSVYMKFF